MASQTSGLEYTRCISSPPAPIYTLRSSICLTCPP